MAQVSKYLRQSSQGYIFYCPGCKEAHHYWTKPERGHVWAFNGNVERPTFTPSLRLFETDNGVEHTICHLFVTDGQIIFCGDSNHDLKGKTVPLPELPDWMAGDVYGDGNP